MIVMIRKMLRSGQFRCLLWPNDNVDDHDMRMCVQYTSDINIFFLLLSVTVRKIQKGQTMLCVFCVVANIYNVFIQFVNLDWWTIDVPYW